MAILVWRQSANSESHSNPPCLSHKSLLSQKRVCHSRGEKFSPTENWGGNTGALGSAWLLVGISTCGLRIARGRALQEQGFCSTQDNEQRGTDEFSSVEKSILNPALITFQFIQLSYWITAGCQVWVSNKTKAQTATEESSSEGVHLKTEPSQNQAEIPAVTTRTQHPHTL